MIGKNYYDKTIQRDMKLWPIDVINQDGMPCIKVQYQQQQSIFTPEEILSMIVEKMKQSAEAYIGKTVTQAVMTVPSYFDFSKRAVQ